MYFVMFLILVTYPLICLVRSYSFYGEALGSMVAVAVVYGILVRERVSFFVGESCVCRHVNTPTVKSVYERGGKVCENGEKTLSHAYIAM